MGSAGRRHKENLYRSYRKRNLFHHRLHRFSRIISSGSRWKKLLICVNLRNLW
ncbi:hypothetical protein FSA03_18515 [Bacteroides fragilis]|uniref:Uncharacterized protein n=1 Tax=Bacteroides fragilis TaxID=817 RepID=A0AB38PI10_BACFG|nr:hypothetical protein F9Z90_19175 [Bacteroides fragilis]TWV39509.1 hypothetical protein FSA06_19600 [Bacteroides fragilis]TWV46226.1 hypothetical protein FSA03_18515 [Bacteroides fragilis]